MADADRVIVNREQLRFSNNDALRAYYEQKYGGGGYKEGGYVLHGVDISAMYHTRRQHSALALLRPKAGDRLLDAGCGTGALAAGLARSCREVHAIDIAVNAFDPRFAAVPNLHFLPMNVEALVYPDSHFEGIVSVETLEHLLHPEKALAELYRVLKPGGRLVITYPTINRTAMKRWGFGRKVSISEHLNEWSYDELCRAIEKFGFRRDKVDGIAFDFGPLLALKYLNRFFAANVTHASLWLRSFPRNSLFVALRLTKR